MGTTAQKLQAILSSKSAIKSAIESKGVTVGNAPLDEYAGLIEDIPTGTDTSDATATAADIASGKTAYIATGKVTGTMPANKFKSLVDRSITSVTADDLDGSTKIGSAAFRGCTSLVDVSLPRSVITIGIDSFFGCSSLKYVVISDSMTRISANAFSGCTSLISVMIYAQDPPTLIDKNAFGSTNNCPIYVPAASVNAYKTATNWSAFADRIFAIQE